MIIIHLLVLKIHQRKNCGESQFSMNEVILENAVEREKGVQDIDVHGELEKQVVTLLVMSVFSSFPGASRACADFRDPTAFSRVIDVVFLRRVIGLWI